ncbi:MAG: NHL repeat-containing protein [Candidatus Latescibacteria bacterium]|nr:NHL repeat-containing protein [Candidatus Latescibacterota bacterium]
MTPEKKNDLVLLWLIIGVSVIGTIYFVWSAVSENTRSVQENPYKYNIDFFKEIDPALLIYAEVNTIPLRFHTVSGIAVDAKDNLYVTGDESVSIFTSEGNVQSTFPTDQTALCLDVDVNGDLYLGMKNHIEIFNSNGIKKAQWEDLGVKAYITSIAITDEYVFAADAGNRIVLKYDKNGKFIQKIGEKDESRDIPGFIVPSPYFDVSVDPDGFLWIVNPGRHTLENYTPEGDLRSSWGEFSMTIEGFCGCCNPTHITIMDSGNFVTSEKGIARIKVFNRLGNLEAVVAGPDRFNEETAGLDLASDSNGRIYILDPMRKAVRIFEKNDPGV